VPKGTGLSGIASSLARANVITSPLLFQASVRFQKQQNSLKHGEYLFEQGVSMKSVVAKLVEGKALLKCQTKGCFCRTHILLAVAQRASK